MIDTKGSNLVFVLCVPRSGSSLTTVMLQNHSKISAMQEMWFLLSLYDLRQRKSRPFGGTDILHKFFNGVLTDELFERACRAYALEVYNGLLYSGESSLVVDKLPRYYLILEFLDRLFPEAKRIWLTRNPLDIAASYKKVHKHLGDPFDLLETLNSDRLNMKAVDMTAGLLRYARYFSGASPHAIHVRYEQVASEPRQELTRLCRFFGVEYEEGMERYGDAVRSGEAAQFFSMGVGNPFLARHAEPHRQSIGRWHEILTREEAIRYCHVIGARIFHELGYAEELADAEKRLGITVPDDPDEQLMERLSRQLADAAGYDWQPGYQLRADHDPGRMSVSLDAEHAITPEVMRLQMMLRSLEMRLEKCYRERDEYKARYISLRRKTDRLKAWIPFGKRLSRLAFGISGEGGHKR